MEKLLNWVLSGIEGLKWVKTRIKDIYLAKIKIPYIKWKNKHLSNILNRIYRYRRHELEIEVLFLRAKLFSNMNRPPEHLVLDNILFTFKQWFYLFKVNRRIRKTFKMDISNIANKYLGKESINYDDYYQWLYLLPDKSKLKELPAMFTIPALIKKEEKSNAQV